MVTSYQFSGIHFRRSSLLAPWLHWIRRIHALWKRDQASLEMQLLMVLPSQLDAWIKNNVATYFDYE
jgi:hypothetical protein